MREFQAENERRRTSVDTNVSTLLDVESNDMILQSISNDQSVPSTPTKQRLNDQQIKTTNPMKTSERRSNFDRNRYNVKTNRYPSDTQKVKYFISNIIYNNHLSFITDTETFK